MWEQEEGSTNRISFVGQKRDLLSVSIVVVFWQCGVWIATKLNMCFCFIQLYIVLQQPYRSGALLAIAIGAQADFMMVMVVVVVTID